MSVWQAASAGSLACAQPAPDGARQRRGRGVVAAQSTHLHPEHPLIGPAGADPFDARADGQQPLPDEPHPGRDFLGTDGGRVQPGEQGARRGVAHPGPHPSGARRPIGGHHGAAGGIFADYRGGAALPVGVPPQQQLQRQRRDVNTGRGGHGSWRPACGRGRAAGPWIPGCRSAGSPRAPWRRERLARAGRRAPEGGSGRRRGKAQEGGIVAPRQARQPPQERRRDGEAGAELQHHQPEGSAPGQPLGGAGRGVQAGDGNHRQRRQIDPAAGDVRRKEGVPGGGDPGHRFGGALIVPDHGAGQGELRAVGVGGQLAQASGKLRWAPARGGTAISLLPFLSLRAAFVTSAAARTTRWRCPGSRAPIMARARTARLLPGSGAPQSPCRGSAPRRDPGR